MDLHVDLLSLPFVKSSYTVRRSDRGGSPEVVARGTQQSLQNAGKNTASSGLFLLPASQWKVAPDLSQAGGGAMASLNWEGDLGSHHTLTHPSKLRKRGRSSEEGRTRQRRRRDDRPDIFEHLAQLRRKQHRFETESGVGDPLEAQAVPSSPLLGDTNSSDVGFFFHGRTPTKPPRKVAKVCNCVEYESPEATIPLALQAGSTERNSTFLPQEGSVTATGEFLLTTRRQLLPQFDDAVAGGRPGGIRLSLSQCHGLQQYAFTQPAWSSGVTELGAAEEEGGEGDSETSFSVPSLEYSTPGLAEVPSLHPHPPLLPFHLSPSPTLPPSYSEPCTLDVASFSIQNYYPREE